MALSAGTLNPDIKTQVYNGLAAQFASVLSGLSNTNVATIQAQWMKLATAVSQSGTAIVQHIVSDAEVTVTGVQSGGSEAMGTVE
jgi:hypothetical protein